MRVALTNLDPALATQMAVLARPANVGHVDELMLSQVGRDINIML
jgi:hypothetical protein